LWVLATLSVGWAVVITLFIKGDGVAIGVAFNLCIATLSALALRFDGKFTVRTLAHLAFAVSFFYIWFLQLKMEGLSRNTSASVHLWFLMELMAALLILIHERRAVMISYTVIAMASFSVCSFKLIDSPSLMQMDPGEMTFARGMTYLSVFVTTILLTFAWEKEVRDAEQNLAQTNRRLEDLLANMLPRAVSDRLKRDSTAFADAITHCSVMFVDIVGFTKKSEGMPPDEVVKLLDDIFSNFDELTTKAGLEKIKTIGDSYMVAAGIPEPRADHAQSLVRLAMEMQAVIRRYGLQIRCGINSGKVVAGVIGRKRFIYDLWGDTVNVASRMESHGVVDEIQMTEATASLVGSEFELTRRDDIEVKGKGQMPVFLVAGVAFGTRQGRNA
jgi:class 3 adenylate cyclase